MEIEDVSEEVKWEAQRITAAFDLQEWEITAVSGNEVLFAAYTEDRLLEWCLDGLNICALAVGDRHNLSSFDINPSSGYGPLTFESSEYDSLLARGLYRLGFEAPSLISELPELSAHQKLELRLSMPREFWPKTWIDGENAAK